jgi:hypothetical protein
MSTPGEAMPPDDGVRSSESLKESLSMFLLVALQRFIAEHRPLRRSAKSADSGRCGVSLVALLPKSSLLHNHLCNSPSVA